MLSPNLILIEETLDKFYIEKIEEPKYLYYKNNSPKNSKKNLIEMNKKEQGIIEYIEEKEYNVKEQEIKYKIFEDISEVSKNINNIELIISLPKTHQILSINKIRFSKNIKNYIKDIYITKNKKIILDKNELLNSNLEKNNINYSSNKQLRLHLILETQGLNTIINKNIYISYSYINLKNKIKYL